MPWHRAFLVITLVVLLLSFLLRVWLVSAAEWHAVSDSRDYAELATSLAQGEGYKQIYNGESPEYRGLTFRAYRLPGYPFILSLLFRFLGTAPKGALYLNIFCDLITQLAILTLGTIIFNRWVGLTASAIFGLQLLWTPLLMSESLASAMFTTFIALCFLYTHKKRNNSLSPRCAAAFCLSAGAIAACLVLIKPVSLVLILWAITARYIDAHYSWRSIGLVSALCALLLVGCWTQRNTRVLGSAVIFSTNFGPHNAKDFGIDRRSVVTQLRAEGAGEVEINKQLTALIVSEVSAHPLQAVALFFSRAIGIFSLNPAHETSAILWKLTFSKRPWIAQRLKLLFKTYWIVYLLAALATFIRPTRTKARVLIYLVFLFAAFHAVISEGNMRFAAPLYPLLSILAAASAASIFQRKAAVL